MADAATPSSCLLYVGFTLIALPTLHEAANGPSLVAFLLCVVWWGYRRALTWGAAWGPSQIGRQASAPTRHGRGAAGSMAGSVLMAAGLWGLAELLEQWDSVILSYPGDIWYWLVLAAVVNAAAQVGDLSESALKRSAADEIVWPDSRV